MRKIKFKAWDKLFNKFVHSGWVIHPNGECEFTESGWGGLQGGIAHQDGFILMQYTGLNDINNKEIFENDILVSCVDECVYKVQWEKEHASYILFEINNEVGLALNIYNINDLELAIVGNMYE